VVVAFAGKVLEAGVVLKAKTQDALHIAVAVRSGADVLLGWDFKHLANINKERLVRALCLMEGYSDKIENERFLAGEQIAVRFLADENCDFRIVQALLYKRNAR
jgi:hypothetical protein